MRALGAVLAVGGLLLAAYYMFVFDTKATIGGSVGETRIELGVTDPERVEDRRNGIMLGLGGVVVGGIIAALSGKK